MTKRLTRIATLVLALGMLFVLTGCGSEVNEKNVKIYVQGNLDRYYKGTCADEFLALMDYTPEEITEIYQEGLDIEFNYMASWFYIETEYISDALYQEGIDLLAAAYDHSDYTVKTPVKNSEGTYMVEVEVRAVDVFAQVYDGDAYSNFIDEFTAQYTQDQINAMSDEEYQAYEDAWARGIFDLCWAAEKNAGYAEAKSIALQVKPDDDNYYTLVGSDFDAIDYMILTYSEA